MVAVRNHTTKFCHIDISISRNASAYQRALSKEAATILLWQWLQTVYLSIPTTKPLQMLLRRMRVQHAKHSWKPRFLGVIWGFFVAVFCFCFFGGSFACTSAKHHIFEVTYSIAQNNVLSILAGNSYKWSHLAKTGGTTGYLEYRILVVDLWYQNCYCFLLASIFLIRTCTMRKKSHSAWNQY